MKRLVLGIGALVAMTTVAAAQTIMIEQTIVYERIIIQSEPLQLAELPVTARASATLKCDKMQHELPWPYFCFVKASASNLPGHLHHLLRPISGDNRLLCGSVKGAYSVAARQWAGQSDRLAAVNIAKKLGGTPCGFADGLVLTNFHISLRTATDPERQQPSWIVAWQDQYERWHFSAKMAPRSVLAMR